MAINRKKFFDGVRNVPFSKKLTQGQVSGMSTILDEWDRRKLTDLRWLAYMLATPFHEVGQTMQPIREGFKDTDALARAYVKRNGYKYAVVINGQVYYGRGLVQLTWVTNYEAMTKLLKAAGYDVDLVKNPELALRTDIAVFIMFEGMIRGTFTGKKLSNYFNAKVNDPIGARRIINGTDKAALIAGYHKQFYADLVAAAA